jgi:cytochrome P450 family 4
MNKKFALPFLYPHTIYKFTKMYREERKAQKILDEFQADILNERRVAVKKQQLNFNNNDGEKDESNERNILIDHIILNEDKFTTEEVRDHLLTFVSGYETWGNALAHAMLALAINSEVQERLFEEIMQTIPSDEDLKTSELINSMPYLDMVQKEILRLFPTVPMILRETLEDFEIEPGLVIPKEVNLLLNFYSLHRRKDIWGENAEEFVPERFSPEKCSNRHQFAFLPFSSGSRICIGYKYSNLSLKVSIVKLLKSFRFKTSMKMEDVRLKSYISLKLCTPHLLTVEKREIK